MTKRIFAMRFAALLLALVGAGVGGWLLHQSPGDSRELHASAVLQQKYPLISRRVLSDNPNDIIINFVPLRKQLEARFDQLDAQKSFYFEYLPSGTSIRAGADQELIAASLIKVPLVMNLYRAAELNLIRLDDPVAITQPELDDAYGDLWKQGAGTKITLRQAAQQALKHSDNTATHVIFDHTKGLLNYDQQSLAQLDVDQDMQNGQAVITAKSYASVLKGLYFASYLSRDDSQEILGYLTQSTATNRIAKGLPAGVAVAHKIGVYNASWSESDCGIVYVPKRPYLLCVMVGLPEDQANDFIATVSRQIYDYVTQQ